MPDAYGGATNPGVLLALGRGGTVGVLDATLVREGVGEPVLPVRHDLDDHPRVLHAARAVRCDVVVRGDERGLVTLATGAAGRRELSVQALRPGTGDGRSLIRDALFGETGPVFAAVSPGNARSLRTTTPSGAAMATLTKLDDLPLTLLTARPLPAQPGRCRLRCCFLGRACLSGSWPACGKSLRALAVRRARRAALPDPTVARPNFLKGRSTEWSTDGR